MWAMELMLTGDKMMFLDKRNEGGEVACQSHAL